MVGVGRWRLEKTDEEGTYGKMVETLGTQAMYKQCGTKKWRQNMRCGSERDVSAQGAICKIKNSNVSS